MKQLRLDFLQPLLGLLPLAQVADEAGEEARAARIHLADGQRHREGRSVPALADRDAAGADDALLAGAEIAREVAVMILAIGRRHQDRDVAAQNLLRAVAEQPLRSGAEGVDRAARVDDDHRVGHGGEDRAQMRLARGGLGPRGAGALAEPRDAGTEQREGGEARQRPGRRAGMRVEKGVPPVHQPYVTGKAGRGGEQAGAEPAEHRGDQHRRHQEQERRLVAHRRKEGPAQAEAGDYQNERQPVGARARPSGRPAAARVGERHRPCSGYRFRHAPSMASSSRTAPPGAPAAASGHREAADHTDFRPIANRLCTFSHTSGNGGQEQRK